MDASILKKEPADNTVKDKNLFSRCRVGTDGRSSFTVYFCIYHLLQNGINTIGISIVVTKYSALRHSAEGKQALIKQEIVKPTTWKLSRKCSSC
jgi:hypothetical protein